LKKLSDVVNVVPVIAKADTLTLEERQAFKERIKEEFAFHNLKMYPYDNDELDDEERAVNAQIKVRPSTTRCIPCPPDSNPPLGHYSIRRRRQ
jgi:septin family protein